MVNIFFFFFKKTNLFFSSFLESWSVWTRKSFFKNLFLFPLTLSFLLDGGAFFLFFFLNIFILGFILDSTADRLIMSVFLIGAQLQMLFSALFHLFCCHSSSWYKYLVKLDYSGISIMIVCSYYPPLYYGFCTTNLKIIYLGILTFLGVIGLCIGFIQIFSTPRFRTFRAG